MPVMPAEDIDAKGHHRNLTATEVECSVAMQYEGPARIKLPTDAQEAPEAGDACDQLLSLAVDLVLEAVYLAQLNMLTAGAAGVAEFAMFMSRISEVNGSEKCFHGPVGIMRYILASIKVDVAACDVVPRCSYKALDTPELEN